MAIFSCVVPVNFTRTHNKIPGSIAQKVSSTFNVQRTVVRSKIIHKERAQLSAIALAFTIRQTRGVSIQDGHIVCQRRTG